MYPHIYNEAEILEPPPSTLHEDDWPCFVLNEARAFNVRSGQLVNFLEVHTDGPFRVTGVLRRVTAKDKSLFRMPEAVGQPIEIKASVRFAYGENGKQDGYKIWAKGDNGWFELSPAHDYLKLFNDMRDSVSVLYFLADLFRSGGPEVSWSIQKLTQLVISHRNGTGPKDAEQLFFKHKKFLLAAMLERKEDIEWKETEIFRQLKTGFPDEFDYVVRNMNSISSQMPEAEYREQDIRFSASVAAESQEDLEVEILERFESSATNLAPVLRRNDQVESLKKGFSRQNQDHRRARTKLQTTGIKGLRPNVSYKGQSRLRPISSTQKTLAPLAGTLDLNNDIKPDDYEPDDMDANDLAPRKRKKKMPALDFGSASEEEDEELDSVNMHLSPLPTYRQQADPYGHSVLRSVIPSTTANRPGDVWICTVPGCVKTIYGATEADGQALIHAHYAEHGASLVERVTLVGSEFAPGRSVSHLLDRIHEVAAKEKRSASTGSSSLPLKSRDSLPTRISKRL